MKHVSSMTLVIALLHPFLATEARSGEGVKRVAAVVTEYRRNTHADAIVSRVFQTDTLDGKGPQRRLKVVSLYMDQLPKGELGRALAKTHGFAVSHSVAGALTLGGDRLAVDAVLLVAEHGDYPQLPYGPDDLSQAPAVRADCRCLPPHGAGRAGLHRQAPGRQLERRLLDLRDGACVDIPLMAGSSLPVTWRYPPDDVQKESRLAEVLVLSYRTLDSYGFHALEIAQALADVRKGGESGVARVRCVEGAEVWRRLDRREVDLDLLKRALAARAQSSPPQAGLCRTSSRSRLSFR